MGSQLPTIDVALARELIGAQFPEWSNLSVVPVLPGGWDNRTFRLGDSMSVRLPSDPGYAEQVAKEQRWLPVLAPQLPLRIPVPLGAGVPSDLFPLPWSVYGWIEGAAANRAPIGDLARFADDLADFLVRLRAIDATDGPGPGTHNFQRGGPPGFYDQETREAIQSLGDSIDGAGASAVWEAALAADWDAAPVWFHGDISSGNLLLSDGILSAVIDFGTSGVGDPACDLVIAFTRFTSESRDRFRSGVGLDAGTWARARGWAIWKALIVAAGTAGTHSPEREARESRRVIAEVIADHRDAVG